jgi:ubiquinone/menaquinone biosynthesis C-methylase UbiE
MSERIFNPSNIHKLEDPERLNWLPPQDVIRLLNLTSGMFIADIGAGSGFFALPFARAIEPAGRLFAVDLQPEMLEFLRVKLRSAGSRWNLELVTGEATATNLDDASCDLVFLGNVWHELDDHARVLREMARILRSGGRVAILDWRTDVPNPPGPPAGHRVAAADAAAALQTAGWAVIESTGVGTYSYLVTARLQAASLTLPQS